MEQPERQANSDETNTSSHAVPNDWFLDRTTELLSPAALLRSHRNLNNARSSRVQTQSETMPGSNLIPRSRATAQHVQLELRRSQISQNKQTTKSQRVQLDLQRTQQSPESERASEQASESPQPLADFNTPTSSSNKMQVKQIKPATTESRTRRW